MTNQFLFYIYLILILMLLVPFSILVSFQLFKLVKSELFFRDLKKTDSNIYTNDQLFFLLKILLRKKLWLTSINLMESQKNVSEITLHKYFNAFGYIYENMKQFDLACVYYEKAVSVKYNYLIALQNLAQIYEKLNPFQALSTYKVILNYDQNNEKAKKYIERNEG